MPPRVDGIDDRVGVAAFAAFPHAVDEELEVGGVVAHGRDSRGSSASSTQQWLARRS